MRKIQLLVYFLIILIFPPITKAVSLKIKLQVNSQNGFEYREILSTEGTLFQIYGNYRYFSLCDAFSIEKIAVVRYSTEEIHLIESIETVNNFPMNQKFEKDLTIKSMDKFLKPFAFMLYGKNENVPNLETISANIISHLDILFLIPYFFGNASVEIKDCILIQGSAKVIIHLIVNEIKYTIDLQVADNNVILKLHGSWLNHHQISSPIATAVIEYESLASSSAIYSPVGLPELTPLQRLYVMGYKGASNIP